MKHYEILDECKAIIGERGVDYGGIEQNFETIAALFTRITGKHVEPHEVALLLACVKLARMRQSPRKRDNFLDLINYTAFAAELIEAE